MAAALAGRPAARAPGPTDRQPAVPQDQRAALQQPAMPARSTAAATQPVTPLTLHAPPRGRFRAIPVAAPAAGVATATTMNRAVRTTATSPTTARAAAQCREVAEISSLGRLDGWARAEWCDAVPSALRDGDVAGAAGESGPSRHPIACSYAYTRGDRHRVRRDSTSHPGDPGRSGVQPAPLTAVRARRVLPAIPIEIRAPREAPPATRRRR
jgi:hypothetical protein